MNNPTPNIEMKLYCNNCGGAIYFPDRMIFPYDGRFCGKDCKDTYEMKRATWVMRGPR